MIYAEILAGGKGTRMGNTALPKQFLDLGGTPILIQTTSKFLLQSDFACILIVVLPEWIPYTKDLLTKHFDETQLERIAVVEGGNDRNTTLMNGISYIEEKYGIKDNDVVVTHDAVRPFVSSRIIRENIEAVQEYGASDTTIAATDTIVVGQSDGEMIDHIPERKLMYQGQTPQSFNILKLKDAYSKLSEAQKKSLTDAAKIMVLTKSSSVKMVKGEEINFKITRSFDLRMAELLVQERD